MTANAMESNMDTYIRKFAESDLQQVSVVGMVSERKNGMIASPLKGLCEDCT